MKKNLKLLLICIAIPVVVGIIAGLLTNGSTEAYMQLNKPPLSPPGWLFPVVWTILYILMGIASYFIVTSGASKDKIESALSIYIIQIEVNFLWSFIFFAFNLICFAFVWLLLLWFLIILTIKRFWDISEIAGKLLIPYLLWVTFAGYLNLAICLIN